MKKDHKELIHHNEISDESKKTFRIRVATALILCAFCVPCLFLGSWYFFALLIVVVGISGYEMVKASSPFPRYKFILYFLTIILLYFMVYYVFVKNNLTAYLETHGHEDFDFLAYLQHLLETGFTTIEISALGVGIIALIYFFLSFLDDRYTIGHVFYYFGMLIFLGLCFQSVLYLRYIPFSMFRAVGVDVDAAYFRFGQSSCLLVFVLIGVFMNDIFAYVFGMLFGKRKMNPRISPKKTWGGFIGGCISSFILSFSFGMIMATANCPILPFLDIEHWYYIFIISLFMPLIATIGDFIFSAIKRYFAIKDFGNILKGHGGVLDRIDSTLFTSLFVAITVIAISLAINGEMFII